MSAKRKAGSGSMSSSSNSSSGGAKKSKITTGADRTELFQEIDYQPLDLDSIYDSIEKLFERVPVVPENGFRKEENGGNGSDSPRDPSLPPLRNPQTQYSQSQIVEWAMELKIVIDELQLLIALISPAVYKWGTDRSGAQDQNHSVLWGELVRSQEHLLNRVVPALDGQLAPNEGLRVSRSVKTTSGAVETEQMYYVKTNEDPDYTEWSITRFAIRAPLLRQVTLANLDKVLKSVHDYMEAQHKDSQHDARRSFY